MDYSLVVAIVAAMLNIVLSLTLPSLFQKTNIPFAAQIKKNYECNRDIILVSSVLTVLLVYTSFQITPFVKTNIFSNLAKLGKN